MIYHLGVDLPSFAAFPLLDDVEGNLKLRSYYAAHVAVKARAGVGFVFQAMTWPASSGWGGAAGFQHRCC